MSAQIRYETLTACPICGQGTIDPWDADAQLVRCVSCSTVFDNPRPDGPSIQEFYSKDVQYDHWLANLEGRDRLWRRRFALLRPYLSGRTLLDVGAGIGQFLDVARSHGFAVRGTELSPIARSIARERFSLELDQGFLEDIAYDEGAFDAVTMFHVLEHVPDPPRTIRECLRLLAPGGLLVIAVPNEVDALSARLHRLARTLGLPGLPRRGRMGLRTLRTHPGLQEIHLTRFQDASLQGLMRAAGLEILGTGPDFHDPATGWRAAAMGAYFGLSRVWTALGKRNPYPTQIIYARKPAAAAQHIEHSARR